MDHSIDVLNWPKIQVTNIFGLQYHEGTGGGISTGQCFTGATWADQGETTVACSVDPANDRAMGHGNANALYEWVDPAAEHAWNPSLPKMAWKNPATMFDSAQEQFLDNMAWNPNAPRLTYKSPMTLVDRSTSVAAQGM